MRTAERFRDQRVVEGVTAENSGHFTVVLELFFFRQVERKEAFRGVVESVAGAIPELVGGIGSLRGPVGERLTVNQDRFFIGVILQLRRQIFDAARRSKESSRGEGELG